MMPVGEGNLGKLAFCFEDGNCSDDNSGDDNEEHQNELPFTTNSKCALIPKGVIEFIHTDTEMVREYCGTNAVDDTEYPKKIIVAQCFGGECAERMKSSGDGAFEGRKIQIEREKIEILEMLVKPTKGVMIPFVGNQRR